MTEFEVTELDPISIGKVSAALYAVMGLIMVLIYAPFMLLMLGMDLGAAAIVGGIVAGILMAAMGVVFYALMGFVMGAFTAYFYNFLVGRIGGVKFKLEEV